MTLVQLRYFTAVCRFHSISKAAQELFVTQPAVSLALKELENEFHMQLFHRARGQLILTEEGRSFYEEASRLLEEAREFHDRFSLPENRMITIKMGIPPMLSTVYFPGLLSSFTEEYPDCPVELSEYGSVRAASLVQEEALDLALVNLEFPGQEQLLCHTMSEESTFFCVSEKHPLAGRACLRLEDLAEEPLLMLNTDSVQNQLLRLRFDTLGIRPRILLNSSQILTVENFLRAGGCGAFLYSSLLPSLPGVTGIPLDPPLKTRVGLIRKKNRRLSRPAETLWEFITGEKP